MKRKTITTAVAILSLVPTVAFAHPRVSITYNGVPVQTDVDPIIKDDRTFVPLRFLSEAMGYKVSWENNTRTAVVEKDGQIRLVIGNKTASVRGKNKELDVAPFIEGERTMVPLRFVSENLGARVFWDQETYTVMLMSAEARKVNITDEPSLLTGRDLSSLAAEDRTYLEAFDANQRELASLLKTFREQVFQSKNYTDPALVRSLTDLSFKINAAAGRAKELQAPPRFAQVQELYVQAADRIPPMMEKFKEAFLLNDAKAANKLVEELTQYSFVTKELSRALDASIQNVKYTPDSSIANYFNKKGDDPLTNLFNRLGK